MLAGDALLRLACCTCCSHSCSRALLAIFGTGLLCALCYIVVLYILLFGGWFNPWCGGFVFNKDPCNEHGVCFSVGECKCDYTYGPDHRYSLGPKGMELNVGEPSCSELPFLCVPGVAIGNHGIFDDTAVSSSNISDKCAFRLSRKTYSVRRECLARTGSSSAQMRIKNNIIVVGCTFHALDC
jgi:hypothetical protein